ncbi:hypothetical protein LOZ12_004259 [Ophidiomyces ophidiicola]|uniref:Uncharacterized protein n=1 Tax=Ophidiomyces ophidiicola TaxID=1387563 RepID=A0ACB8UUE9_9EURO|nr:hypothetical protein LOZ62_004271 [Ophidiomyces ophidiicola]KAI1970355.1 hypothetical protein LOZ56_003734 [Ophidiomyces ophidiicola]KAI2004034.1 hypothetical protein LOZ50_004479 [Ophidiomyces ophidiicola]KAI2037372.1 hypothetical protein LOZ47_003780 [Ophidiomyces ophidiicola]KAI2046933.1 hypothetical protein LOZ44_004294 [Ophidiomyces ophidiicola]
MFRFSIPSRASVWAFFSSIPACIGFLFSRPTPPTEKPDEEFLSLDLAENDYLYRTGFCLLKTLGKLPEWDEEWKTLTVRRIAPAMAIESTRDEFLPHGLNLENLNMPSATPFFSFLDLPRISRISDRLFRVMCDGEICILKIAKFKHELSYLHQEISVYLKLSDFAQAPKFVGVVYEETKNRTIGFLIGAISGRHPDINDFEACKKTVDLLHTHGIIHGDLNRYNFLINNHGAQIFDFENSVLKEDAAAAEEEIQSFEAMFQDESDIGRRWERYIGTDVPI